MRAGVVALLAIFAATAAYAKDPSPDSIKGLYLTTDFPALQIRAGEETSLPLTIYNYGLPPQRTALTIADAPADWKPTLEGSGKPATAAFVDYDGRANLNLKLNIPATAKPGPYKITINAQGDSPDAKSSLPIAITLAAPLAAKLTATPKFPVLKGTPKSNFDFNVSVKNESSADMTVNLSADLPKGFTATFKEGYNTQEITSLSIKANESKDLTISVKPGPNAAAGRVPFKLHITGDKKATVDTTLTMDISGQPSITVSGQDERLSGDAVAGEERSFAMVVHNTGTAAARGLTLSSDPPSGWKVTFEPKEIAEVAPGADATFNALVTPAAKAIAGDYIVTMRASGDGVSESASYRVTVRTSTMWGVAGIGVIGAALIVLVGSVWRFGRR
jgi:uncharacterized membrane protein